eukprot:6194354-Pleurochrysis_carterae.AAC.7
MPVLRPAKAGHRSASRKQESARRVGEVEGTPTSRLSLLADQDAPGAPWMMWRSELHGASTRILRSKALTPCETV